MLTVASVARSEPGASPCGDGMSSKSSRSSSSSSSSGPTTNSLSTSMALKSRSVTWSSRFSRNSAEGAALGASYFVVRLACTQAGGSVMGWPVKGSRGGEGSSVRSACASKTLLWMATSSWTMSVRSSYEKVRTPSRTSSQSSISFCVMVQARR